mgnify:CR=1 FL=1
MDVSRARRAELAAAGGARLPRTPAVPGIHVDRALTRAEKVISGGENEVRIQAALSNGEKAYVDITGAGENGFRGIMTSEGKTLAVRGTTFLHPVEEVYRFGEM